MEKLRLREVKQIAQGYWACVGNTEAQTQLCDSLASPDDILCQAPNWEAGHNPEKSPNAAEWEVLGLPSLPANLCVSPSTRL